MVSLQAWLFHTWLAISLKPTTSKKDYFGSEGSRENILNMKFTYLGKIRNPIFTFIISNTTHNNKLSRAWKSLLSSKSLRGYGYFKTPVLSALHANPTGILFPHAGGLHFTASIGPVSSQCVLHLWDTLYVAFLPSSLSSFRGRIWSLENTHVSSGPVLGHQIQMPPVW